MRAALLSLPSFLVLTAVASAACNVQDARIEEAIAAKKELQESANKQTVRDLRTLRDAAIVLESYAFDPECERLVAIVRTLIADPKQTIERSGDTDEEKAEAVEESREPKTPAKSK